MYFVDAYIDDNLALVEIFTFEEVGHSDRRYKDVCLLDVVLDLWCLRVAQAHCRVLLVKQQSKGHPHNVRSAANRHFLTLEVRAHGLNQPQAPERRA
jgi:hypothetical protein